MFLLFVEHIFSCVWLVVGFMGVEWGEPNWIEAAGILDLGYTKQYLTSFYFATVTMISVGYGDILPKSNSIK